MDDLFLNPVKKEQEICVLSFATDNIMSWAEGVFANNKEYCERHNYTWKGFRDLKDKSRPTNWSKIAYILEEMKNDCDWIFWIDADAIIMNHFIKLEEFINDDYDFVVTHSPCGWCTGTWLINNNIYSRKLLEYTYSKEEFINHPSGVQVDSAFYNAAYEKGSRTIALEQTKLNSFPHYKYYRNFGEFTTKAGVFNFKTTYEDYKKLSFKDGDFILHMAGFNNGERKNIYNNYKERIMK